MKDEKRKIFFLKKIFKSGITLMVLFAASCAKDDSSTPQNTSDDRSKYVRSWTCDETSAQQGNSTYTITISKDVTTANQIIVKNFYNLGTGTNTVMIVDGSNVTISSQNVSGHIISGSGTYHSSSSLTFSFTADDGITVDNASIAAH